MSVNTNTNSLADSVIGRPVQEKAVSGLVLVCGDSPVSESIVGMEHAGDAWDFVSVRGLCGNTGAIGEIVAEMTLDRLIVGMCRGGYSPTELLSHARGAGIETFGTQILEIPASENSFPNKAAAVTAIRGAIARAEAFVGAAPENVKTTFSASGEKISRRALFTIPPIEYRPVPTVDRLLCIAGSGCSQCEKACPHGAIKNVAGAVKVDVGACNSCGICVAACPQRAVEFPFYSADEIESQVDAVLADSSGEPKNIAFVCSDASELPGGDWQVVPVACAGMVPAAALLSAVASGARSVGILRCVEQCAQRSSQPVEGRVDYVRSVLEMTGDDPRRVMNLAPADSGVVAVVPDITAPAVVEAGSAEIFGRSAASGAVLALNKRTDKPIERFVHEYSPIGIPVVNSVECTMCGTCSAVCPTGALSLVDSGGWVELTLDAAKCIACGECVTGCPEISNGAIELILRTDVTALTIGPVILNGDLTISCTTCEKPFTSARTLKRLENLLGEAYTYERYGARCPECRTLG